jgi:drug/metabolite transporter (DMT)-like permease
MSDNAEVLKAQSVNQSKLGIVLILVGLCLAASNGAIMKFLSTDMSAYQITWFRFFGYAAIMIPLVAFRFGRAAFKPVRLPIQILRGVSIAASTVAFVIGAKTVDYADAIAILYAYPFMLTLLAVGLLGERVSLIGWIGVSGGFVGVLLIMRPDFGQLETGTGFIFFCSVVVSIQMALNRKLGSISHPLVTSMWGASIAALILSALLIGNWQPILEKHIWLIVAMIITGAFSQTLMVFAFSKTAASTLAPFTYFEIIAAVVVGFLVFDTLPTLVSWIGIALIIASGLLVARTLTGRHTSRRMPKF